MVYTAKTAKELREQAGSLLSKIATELGLIATELATTEGEKIIVTVPVSFVTANQMATKVYFPFKVTVNKIRSVTTGALSANDAGTITGANSTGDSATGVLTLAASEVVATEHSVSPTTNNVVLADGYYSLTTLKTTTGGTALVTIEATRTA
jgi:hypothetical protein